MSIGKMIRRAQKAQHQIVTPRLTKFLAEHQNLVLDDRVADLIREQTVKPPRDRSGSFSSSAAGVCPRRQIFGYCGVEPENPVSPETQNVFFDGTWRHLRWQAVLLMAGILDSIEYPLAWPAQRSVGTMDGVGTVPADHSIPEIAGAEFGFELKGINPYGFKQITTADQPRRDHLRQVHRYFLSGGFEVFVVVYENKATQEWTEFVIAPDPALLDEQRAELATLNDLVDKKVLPAMLSGCVDKISPEWTKGYCPYSGKGGICISALGWPGDG